MMYNRSESIYKPDTNRFAGVTFRSVTWTNLSLPIPSLGQDLPNRMVLEDAYPELAKLTPEEKAAGKNSLGDIKMDQIVKIAKMKQSALFCKTLKACVKQVVGTCASMPITVEGKKAIEVVKEIDEGKYDSLIQ